MVEVLAENYHNIWAKKKKTELISKGMQMLKLKIHHYIHLRVIYSEGVNHLSFLQSPGVILTTDSYRIHL